MGNEFGAKDFNLESWNGVPIVLKVTFGSPTPENANIRVIPLQLVDSVGKPVAQQSRVLLACTNGVSATMSAGTGEGTVQAGDNTEEMIILTGINGRFNIEVTCTSANTVQVLAGVTVGSAILDCSDTVSAAFV